MAIAATTGNQANSSSSVSSLALPSFNQSVGGRTIVLVVLGSTSSSVTSITDTKGNTYALMTSVNGTGVRTEIWACVNSGAQTNDIITVNISPATTIAAAAGEYSGVTNFGNTGTASGSNYFAQSRSNLQESGNYMIGSIGFACQSGDTLTQAEGTSRRTSIPAATAVGVGMIDNTIGANCNLPTSYKISASRAWAAACLELRSGGVTVPYVEPPLIFITLAGRRGAMPDFNKTTGTGGPSLSVLGYAY